MIPFTVKCDSEKYYWLQNTISYVILTSMFTSCFQSSIIDDKRIQLYLQNTNVLRDVSRICKTWVTYVDLMGEQPPVELPRWTPLKLFIMNQVIARLFSAEENKTKTRG